jgi:hypothetical protein
MAGGLLLAADCILIPLPTHRQSPDSAAPIFDVLDGGPLLHAGDVWNPVPDRRMQAPILMINPSRSLG